MRISAICAASVFASLLVLPADAPAQWNTVNTLMLHEKDDIPDAQVLRSALYALIDGAQACPMPRTDKCICSFRSSVDRLADAYRRSVAKHPAWGEPHTGIEYQDPAHGTVGIVMSNVKRQLDVCGSN